MDGSLSGSSVHGISKEEYWSGLPLPSPGDLADLGIEPRESLAVDSLPLSHLGSPQVSVKFLFCCYTTLILLCFSTFEREVGVRSIFRSF